VGKEVVLFCKKGPKNSSQLAIEMRLSLPDSKMLIFDESETTLAVTKVGRRADV
jgi:hypothetical protein